MRASKRPQALIVWQLQRKVPIRRHTKWPLLHLWVAEPSLVQASQGCAVLCTARRRYLPTVHKKHKAYLVLRSIQVLLQPGVGAVFIAQHNQADMLHSPRQPRNLAKAVLPDLP